MARQGAAQIHVPTCRLKSKKAFSGMLSSCVSGLPVGQPILAAAGLLAGFLDPRNAQPGIAQCFAMPAAKPPAGHRVLFLPVTNAASFVREWEPVYYLEILTPVYLLLQIAGKGV